MPPARMRTAYERISQDLSVAAQGIKLLNYETLFDSKYLIRII